MSKMKWLGIAVTGLLVVNLLMVGVFFFKKDSPAPGLGPMPGPPLRPAPKEYIIAKLQLDENQKAVYEKAVARHRGSINKLEEELKDIKDRLYETLSDQQQHAPEKDSLMARLLQVQKEIEDIHYNHFLEIKAICRPGQMALYNELSKEFSGFFVPPKRPPHPPER